jgi:hypothetical protein
MTRGGTVVRRPARVVVRETSLDRASAWTSAWTFLKSRPTSCASGETMGGRPTFPHPPLACAITFC